MTEEADIALDRIDGMLTVASNRDLFTADEITDLLLDIRPVVVAASTPREEEPTCP